MLERLAFIALATSGLFIEYTCTALTPFAYKSIICSLAYIMPAYVIALGLSPNLSIMRLKRVGRYPPERDIMRLMLAALVTGIMPAMTGT